MGYSFQFKGQSGENQFHMSYSYYASLVKSIPNETVQKALDDLVKEHYGENPERYQKMDTRFKEAIAVLRDKDSSLEEFYRSAAIASSFRVT